MAKQITVTEDQALGKGVSIKTLVDAHKAIGYHVVTSYQHEALGLCIVMEAGEDKVSEAPMRVVKYGDERMLIQGHRVIMHL